MKSHGSFEYFTAGPIIYIKLIDNTNIECIRQARKKIEEFRETQHSKVLYVTDFTKWEFAPPEVTDFMKVKQEEDASEGLLKVIVVSNNNLISDLANMFIASHKNRENIYSFVSNQSELYKQIEALGFSLEQFKNKYEQYNNE